MLAYASFFSKLLERSYFVIHFGVCVLQGIRVLDNERTGGVQMIPPVVVDLLDAQTGADIAYIVYHCFVQGRICHGISRCSTSPISSLHCTCCSPLSDQGDTVAG